MRLPLQAPVVAAAVLLGLTLAAGTRAQQAARCDSSRPRWAAAAESADSVVVYARLRPAVDTAPVPAWYLQAVLGEVVSRFRAAGASYDPLVDVRVRIDVPVRGAALTLAELGSVQANLMPLEAAAGSSRNMAIGVVPASAPPAPVGPVPAGTARAAPMPGGPPNGAAVRDSLLAARRPPRQVMSVAASSMPGRLRADSSSVLTRLTTAVVEAGRDSALPPLPAGAGDALALVLELRPALGALVPAADSLAATMPLFRAANLHVGRAHGVFFEGEVDTPARWLSASRMPRWPDRERARGGAVLLAADVDTAGRVAPGGAGVIRSRDGFAEAALDAVRRWRFAPARIAGCAVNTELGVVVLFAP